MRRLLAAISLLLVAAAPPAIARNEQLATLAMTVGADHAETMDLTFEGLDRLVRYHGICLPEGAVESRVHDALGDLPYEGREEDGRRALTFTARTESVTIDMSRPGASSTETPLHSGDLNFCVPSDTFVRVTIGVPEDHTLFFVTGGGTISDGRVGTIVSEGPTHVFYSYEAPRAAGASDAEIVIFDEGPFRAFVAADLEDEARVVVGLAADPFQAALAEAGLARPFDQLRVRFVRDTPFSWEAGHYNGQGYITVKEAALEKDPAAGFPYAAVKVLVHESFHAASFPYGKGAVEDDMAWWLEGTARHSERHVDDAMPNATIRCERELNEVRCLSFDDRISRADLDLGYDPTFAFDAAWEPSLPQTEETRRFYYGFSEFVVGAWIAQNGDAGYRAAWDKIAAAFDDSTSCPCENGWLTSLTGGGDIFRPWSDVRASDPPGFEARVGPLVKNDQALEDALRANSNPLTGLGIPAPLWIAGVALGIAGLARRRAPR